MAKTKTIENMKVKFQDGKLQITVPVSSIIESGQVIPASKDTAKSHLVATTHGTELIAGIPGAWFSLNVGIKKNAYDQIQLARKHLEAKPVNDKLAKLAQLDDAKLEKLLKLIELV